MIVHVYDRAQAASVAAAQLFAAAITGKPNAVLGLATGSTPVESYKQLIGWQKEGLLDMSECLSFNLDEYVGLGPDHKQSYRWFMDEQLFNHVPVKESHVPSGVAKNLAAECRRYDKMIEKAGGIDIQFLGLGINGHIGFNEPASSFRYGTNVVELSQETLNANRRFFSKDEVMPTRAITMGMGAIMNSGHVVLVALGEAKAKAVRQMVKGDVDPQWPCSILRLHRNCTVLLDEGAASLL